MKTLVSLLLALLFSILTINVAAQTPTILQAGILNGRTKTMPQPDYPESARVANVGALIAVKVVVDESGSVVSAQAEIYDQHNRQAADGTKLDPLLADLTLREAAEEAARKATFVPIRFKGQPVKIEGKLIYNFVADNSGRPPRIGEIFGPRLNSRATFLPQPAYPEIAMS